MLATHTHIYMYVYSYIVLSLFQFKLFARSEPLIRYFLLSAGACRNSLPELPLKQVISLGVIGNMLLYRWSNSQYTNVL